MLAAIRHYHPLVWVVVVGTVFARGASFMSLPFLTIYLSEQTGLNAGIVGVAVGMGAITGALGGFFGGNLSDRYGRKKVLVGTLLVWGLVFIGFGLTTNILIIMLLNLLNGLCRSFFEPTSQALLSDVAPPDKKLRVFSYRYMAINIGAAVGPLLGAYLAIQSAGLAFLITGVVYILYGLVFYVMMGIHATGQHIAASTDRTRLGTALNIIRKDLALGLFIIASIIVIMGYSQMDTTLPLALDRDIDNPKLVYPLLLTINALVVILFQAFVTRWAEKRPVLLNLAVGTALTSVGLFLFALGSHWAVYVVGIIIFTLGEILLDPSFSLFIDQIAKEDLKGTYFGAGNFRTIGFFFGPSMGGFLLDAYGGTLMFVLVGLFTAVSIILYWIGYKVYLNNQPANRMANIEA